MSWKRSVERLIDELGLEPILVDVGASGHPPRVWAPIARYSNYLGFDPDLRDIRDDAHGAFRRAVVFNEAVGGPGMDKTEVDLFLTSSPHCSSTLLPNPEVLADYFFVRLFDVEGKIKISASCLERVLERGGFDRVDWLKTDSQGIDLRIVQGLHEKADDLLAVDIEPGLINAYHGEDFFVDAHRELSNAGFWLSDLDVKGSVRINTKSVERLKADGLAEALIGVSRNAPGWVEARYLRDLTHLARIEADPQRYAMLWCFAMLQRQFGFAVDIALEFENRFGSGEVASLMFSTPAAVLRGNARHIVWQTTRRALGKVRRWIA